MQENMVSEISEGILKGIVIHAVGDIVKKVCNYVYLLEHRMHALSMASEMQFYFGISIPAIIYFFRCLSHHQNLVQKRKRLCICF